ncbi:MAG: PIN domain-containing protein [Thermodesulfobacteriota bacterium]
MRERIFVDTWGWVALGHKKDTRHKEIARFYREAHRRRDQVITSDYVLDELITLLFRREHSVGAMEFVDGILSSAEADFIKIEKITPEYFDQAWTLRKRFKENPFISFTDLTSMVLMKEMGINKILTEDHHFFQLGMGLQKIL